MKISNKSDEPIIIAEVGQNHQGDLSEALKYIEIFAQSGATVVKFQTRNNKYLFSEDAYAKEYNSENAFAKTYGAHREKLELDPDALMVLKEECGKHGVKFMSTPFDEPSLELLAEVGVDMIKIASFDLGNLPFISKIAQKNIPVVMSTGGGNIEDVKASVAILKESVSDISVLHCVSEYPCPANRLGLATIQDYITEFPECRIGSSDHFNGILSGPVAYMLGARIFEKHVTLNRAQKGTDHSFALEPHGFSNFVRDIHRVPEMMPTKNDGSLGKEAVFQKLGKSIVASKNLNKGDKIQMDDLSGRIFSEQHVPVRESKNFIGAVLQNSIQQGELINYEDLQN
jgi:N-acetylneuraminate synthase/sialic acid synthase|tara:strand:- start:836 stop:1864 length:1029 start_codon:yes stop_codon:yes gene_type:complete